MGSFFGSRFYKQLRAKLRAEWPLSDETYSKLFQTVDNPEMAVPRAPDACITEDSADDNRSSQRKSSRDDDDVTDSGRKIASFSD